MFVQRINPLTQVAEWVAVEAPGGGGDGDESAGLVASSSYLDMLTDTRRNRAYRLALQRTIQPGDCIVDIGTGTGLLAMMAAQTLRDAMAGSSGSGGGGGNGSSAAPMTGIEAAGASSDTQATCPSIAPRPTAGADASPDTRAAGCVWACEVFPPMARLSKSIVAHNGLADCVTVIALRSDELTAADASSAAPATPLSPFPQPAAAGGHGSTAGTNNAAAGTTTPPPPRRSAGRRAEIAEAALATAARSRLPRRADVIVTEIFDSELLGEGLLPTLRHAVQHLLKEGGHVIPATATLWAQAVSSPLLWSMAQLSHHTEAAGGDAAALGAPAAAAPVPVRDAAADAASVRVRAILSELAELDGGANVGMFGSSAPQPAVGGDADSSARCAAGGGVARAAAAVGGIISASPPLHNVHELHIDALFPELLCPLSDPVALRHIDLANPPLSNTDTVTQAVAHTSGTAHALVLWWQLGMDTSGQVLLGTAPAWVTRADHGADGGPLQGVPQRWRDHWKQCFAPVGATPLHVAAGDALRLTLRHDDTSISVAAATVALPRQPAASTAGSAAGEQAEARDRQGGLAMPPSGPVKAVLCPLLSWLGSSRLWQLHDEARWRAFAAALDAATATVPQVTTPAEQHAGDSGSSSPAAQLSTQSPQTASAAAAAPAGAAAPAAAAGTASGAAWQPAAGDCGWDVICLGDGPMLPLLAALSPGVASITTLQGGAGDSGGPAAGWLAAASAAMGVPPGKLQCARSRPYLKRAQAAAAAAAEGGSTARGGLSERQLLLLAEPYYRDQAALPWAHLRFWHEFDTIRQAQPRRPTTCLPRAARVCGVAAALPELWRSRRALGRVEGLDLSPANAVLGVVGAPAVPAPGAASCAEVQRGNAGQLPILPYAVWQAGGGYQELSQRFELMTLDCSGPVHGAQGQAVLTCRDGSSSPGPGTSGHLGSAGAVAMDVEGALGSAATAAPAEAVAEAVAGQVCHAVVVWLDYDLGTGAAGPRVSGQEAAAGVASSSGRGGGTEGGRWWSCNGPQADGRPSPSVQGVYLLNRPVVFLPSRASAGTGSPELAFTDGAAAEAAVHKAGADRSGAGELCWRAAGGTWQPHAGGTDQQQDVTGVAGVPPAQGPSGGEGEDDEVGCAPVVCQGMRVMADMDAEDGDIQLVVELLM